MLFEHVNPSMKPCMQVPCKWQPIERIITMQCFCCICVALYTKYISFSAGQGTQLKPCLAVANHQTIIDLVCAYCCSLQSLVCMNARAKLETWHVITWLVAHAHCLGLRSRGQLVKVIYRNLQYVVEPAIGLNINKSCLPICREFFRRWPMCFNPAVERFKSGLYCVWAC